MRARALLVSVAASITFLAAPAAPAPASPGALRVLVVEAMCNPSVPPVTLRDQILDEPGVASVELIDGSTATVSVAELRSHDAVVAVGDCGWLNAVATGDNLADFQDGGGVVIGAGSDWRSGAGGTLSGRWISAGHSPFEVGSSPAFDYEAVGWQDSSNPILSGIPGFQDDEGEGPLSAYYRFSVSPAAGAAEIARWADGTPAVAVKGRAVGINAYIGDRYGPGAWSGDFGTLVVNAANVLGPHPSVARTPIACIVPKLKGEPLGVAGRRLKRARCSIGKVRGNGTTVRRQSVKPGATRAPGWKVNLRLG
jgi:hypothetical protein